MKQKLWAEFFGTFALVFCGTGAIVSDHFSNGSVGNTGVALTFGLVIMTMIYTFGDISGAHFNPSVTLAFAAAKRFEQSLVAPYIAAQTAGAVCASTVIRLLFTTGPSWGVTKPSGASLQSLLLEIVMTWFLMLAILNVSTGAKEKGITAGLVVGGVICMDALFGGPISGASMNPARSFGPALVSLDFGSLWIYIVGPIVGALLAVPTFQLVRGTNENSKADDTAKTEV